ncbi:AAA family ATPase [Cryptosporangium sp. NPDC051539]|uniref:helix-turn-helix transcriptional regulator n=1 Tax=Cryptosporangium sp. NPDC051539 TaxID=3363962 RepID=UPI0037A39C88
MRGRAREQARLDAVLARVRSGAGGGALLVRGAPGTGKTALLEYAASAASAGAAPLRVLRTAGVDAESALPFAALQRVLMPLSADVARLPAGQAALVRGALERGVDEPRTRFALSVAVLNLLVVAGQPRPVLCCVDDVDHLDRASRDVLAFAARRVASEHVVLLAASTGPGLPGVEQVELGGLGLSAGQELLAGFGVGPEVAAELVGACGGAPLALREVAAALTPAQARGAAPLPVEFPRGSRIRQAYESRLRSLPGATRDLLLLLAAAPDGLDVETLAAAADGPLVALGPAEAAGLVEVADGRLRFAPPLVGGGLYAAAPPESRREAHRRLAGALAVSAVSDDPTGPGDRVRWLLHVAAAGDAPADRLARQLSEAAAAVRARGDHAAASLAAERAADLSPHAGLRAEQLLAAARDAWLAGRGHRAGVLLAGLRPSPATEAGGLRDLLRGQIELRAGSPTAAHEALLGAATDLADRDRTTAVVALLHAGEASFLTGNLRRFVEISLRVLALREGGEPPERELMFAYAAGMMALFRGRHSEAVTRLRDVLDLAGRVPRTDDPTALTWATLAALMLGEESRAFGLTERAGAGARLRGELALVPRTLELATFAQLWLGRYGSAQASAREGLRLAQDAGLDNSVTLHRSMLALFATLQGDDDTGLRLATVATEAAQERGLAMPHVLGSWALAHRDLAAGRAADAAGRLRALAEAGGGPGYVTGRVLTAPHYVEAAVRSGDRAGAAGATGLFGRWASTTGSAAARALLARCQALTASAPDDADDAYREALRLHLLADSEFERARTELLYGRELRRRRGPSAARAHLRGAYDTFERLGATSWAEQCRRELRATGESLRPTAAHPATGPRPTVGSLTVQQRTIAEIVAQGATNREVAAQLYLSPRTVDHHLRNIFVKLGVRSRVELVRLLGSEIGP